MSVEIVHAHGTEMQKFIRINIRGIPERKMIKGALLHANRDFTMLNNISRPDIPDLLAGFNGILESINEDLITPESLSYIRYEAESAKTIPRQSEFARDNRATIVS